jgi:hypothetical protein
MKKETLNQHHIKLTFKDIETLNKYLENNTLEKSST